MFEFGPWYLAAALVFAVASVWLSLVDVREQRLPNKILWPATGLIFVLLSCQALFDFKFDRLLGAVLAGSVSFVVYAVMRFISPSSIGFGDVKLSVSIGLMLGWQAWQDVALAALFGFVLGAVFAAVALATKKASLKSHIAFGPFMLAGAWLMMFI